MPQATLFTIYHYFYMLPFTLRYTLPVEGEGSVAKIRYATLMPLSLRRLVAAVSICGVIKVIRLVATRRATPASLRCRCLCFFMLFRRAFTLPLPVYYVIADTIITPCLPRYTLLLLLCLFMPPVPLYLRCCVIFMSLSLFFIADIYDAQPLRNMPY